MKNKSRVDGLDHVVAAIRAMTTRHVPAPASVTGAKVPKLDLLLRDAVRVVEIAGSVGAQADGYAARTPLNGNPGGGKGGGVRMPVEFVEDGVRGVDPLPTSSTEMAAVARPMPDPVAQSGKRVLRHLAALERALVALEAETAGFERIRSTALVPDPPMCWLAQVRYRLPYDVMWDVQHDGRTTDFAGQLDQPFDEPRRVSMFVYWFVRNHKRLPERAEMLGYLERQTVKVRG